MTNTLNYATYINGASVNVISRTLQLSLAVGRRSTCSFDVWQVDGKYHFQHSENVRIYDRNFSGPLGLLVFSGYIDSPTERFLGNENMLVTKITCMDEHYLADKRVIAGYWINKTCGQIVYDILSRVLGAEGVGPGIIQKGPVMGEFIATYEKISSVMDRLAAAANFWWAIDTAKHLQFQSYTTTFAPWSINEGKDLEYGSFTVTRNNPSYRNRQYIIGAKERTKTLTEHFKGDGSTRAWVARYQVADTPKIYVNGTLQDIGSKNEKDKKYYWNQGDPVIGQDDSVTLLTSSDDLELVYTGEYDVVVVSNDAQQISQQKSIEQHTTGIVEEVEQDQTVTTAKNGLNKIRQLLARYAAYGQLIQFTTKKGGLEPGQLLTATYAPHELFGAEMLIESVDITDRDGINLWYTVKGIIGPYDVTWVQFYASLLARGAINVDRSLLDIAEITANILTFTGQMNISASYIGDQSTALICRDTSSICGGQSTLICGFFICGANIIDTTSDICGNGFICGANALYAGNSTICG